MALVETGAPSTVRFSDGNLTYSTLRGNAYDRAVMLMNTRFEQAEMYSRAKFERFYRWEKLGHMVSKKKASDWKANAFLPYAFSTTEQSAAYKWLALFLMRPYVTVRARKSGLDDIALRREALLDWHFTGDVNVKELAIHMLRISERYGKAIAVVAPEWDTTAMKYRSTEIMPTALGPIARMSWKMAQKRDYKIRARHIDNTDFFPEPYRRRINGPGGMRWCFRRENYVIDQLREWEAANLIGPSVGGQSVEEIKDTHDQESNEYKQRRLFLNAHDDVSRYKDNFDRNVEILEYQGSVPREMVDPQVAEMEAQAGRNPYERLMILANKKVVLENIAMPWDHGMKTYIELDCVPDPWDFWGKGKIEPVEHLCYAGNEIVNSRLDNVKMAINGLIGVDANRMPPGWKRRLVSQPWGVLECAGPPNEVIQRIMLGDVTASSYTEQQQIFSLIQEGSGINETMLGAPGPARTLGEHQLKSEASSKRLQFEAIGQAEQFLGFPYGLAGHIIGLDRQYLPIGTYVGVTDPQMPDDFTQFQMDTKTFEVEDQLFTYSPTGSTEGMNLQAKRADLGDMLRALTPFMPLLLQGGLNLGELVKTIIRTFGYDPSRFFPKVQGVQEMMQANPNMMAALAAMQPGGPLAAVSGGANAGGGTMRAAQGSPGGQR